MGYLDQWTDDGRTCTACDTHKPWDKFPPRAKGKNGRDSVCRACVAARRRAYREENRDRINESERKRYHAVGVHTQRTYGITRPEWDRRVKAQDGRCAVPACRRRPRRRLVGDHCHVSGKFRGIICDQCNVAMGLTGDNPTLLRALAEWIEQER